MKIEGGFADCDGAAWVESGLEATLHKGRGNLALGIGRACPRQVNTTRHGPRGCPDIESADRRPPTAARRTRRWKCRA